MCGFIFVRQTSNIFVNKKQFYEVLNSFKWRGPDAQNALFLDDGKTLLGHNRLAILDLSSRANQPIYSSCGSYVLLFNGEIYNHKEIRKKLGIKCRGNSDTETIIEAFSKFGKDIIKMLDGMYALVIYDISKKVWYSARDRFGIKPLYSYIRKDLQVIGSEPAAINKICNMSVDYQSVQEWKLFRRPVPGKTFFMGIEEQLPATIWDSTGNKNEYWKLAKQNDSFSQSYFEEKLIDSVKRHELSEVPIVSLLSGGLDSGIIVSNSNTKKTYTVGLPTNNEFQGAANTAKTISVELESLEVSADEMELSWRNLTKMKGEPLSVPNEALIYLICKRMKPEEKVVLTGEGADELLFGYDKIFWWAVTNENFDWENFISRYGYSDTIKPTKRFIDFVDREREGKLLIEFLEDFFHKFHLPGLLRRMDFASMAASKEARVPFVDTKLIEYCYRLPSEYKINKRMSKIPIRNFAEKKGLYHALNAKKVGFSASRNSVSNKMSEYKFFQKIVMEELSW